jgi:hypothetical protein
VIPRAWILPAVLALVSILVIVAMAVFDFTDLTPFVGLLGVIVGATISEASRHQSESLARQHQLRLAALDRRLQAHQEAYALWRHLLFDAWDPTAAPMTARQCQDWWDNNCLYLDPASRSAFQQAFLTADTFHVTQQSRDPRLIQAETEIIRRVGEILVAGVELPPISKGEDKTIQGRNGDA